MKRAIFTLLFAVCFTAGYSQLYNNGGTITVESGATLVVEGDYTSTNSGLVDIDGTVELKGDLINTSGGIESSSSGILKFTGTSGAQEITGATPTTFYCAVEVDNAAGVALTNTSTGAPAVLNSTLTLTNGTVTLNEFDLTMSGTGITGASASKYIVTNGTGQLKGTVAASDVTFPVGNATYNPVVLNNAGTSDTYGVIANETMPTNWTTSDHAVAVTWTVTETGGGGDLTVTPQWNSGEEQTSFDNTDCAVGLTTDDGSTFIWGASSAAAGTDPYTQSASNFTDVGKFVVGDYWHVGLDLNLNIILAGAFDGSSMSTALRTANLIPNTDPYYGTTTLGVVPAGVVDWVSIELRDKNDNTSVLYHKEFFIDASGQLINTDGLVGGKLQTVPKDQYYISVRHRNHLGVMTGNIVDLSSGSASFDFTNPGSAIYGTNPLYNWGGSGVMTLWSGNTFDDNTVQYLSGDSDINPIAEIVFLDPGNTNFEADYVVSNVYDDADTDLNGTVEYLSGTSDINAIATSVFLHPANSSFAPDFIVTEQLP